MKKAHVLKRFSAIALTFALFFGFASIKSLALGEDSDVIPDPKSIDAKIESWKEDLPQDIVQADLMCDLLSQYEKGSKINKITEIKLCGDVLTVSGEIELPDKSLTSGSTIAILPGVPANKSSTCNLLNRFLSNFECGTKVLKIIEITVYDNSSVFIRCIVELPNGRITTGGGQQYLQPLMNLEEYFEER